MSDENWQVVARSAAVRRAREPLRLWLAGPVERDVASGHFRECACDLGVTRPSGMTFIHADRGAALRSVRTVVDTGCTNTAVRADVAAALGLPPIGITEVRTGSSGDEAIACQVVMADLRMIDRNGSSVLLQHELTVLDMSDEMLLGMDLLRGGVLTVDLVEGVWDWRYYAPEPRAP